MELREFFAEDAIQLELAGATKDDILKELIGLLQLGEKDEGMLFKMLKRRENLGSTGIGRGIAIPHCRLPGCQAPISAVLHLDAAVDFDAIDGAPVDLLFVLLVPEAATDEHLELLRQIASMLDRADVRERLRQAQSNEGLYQVVVDVQSGH